MGAAQPISGYPCRFDLEARTSALVGAGSAREGAVRRYGGTGSRGQLGDFEDEPLEPGRRPVRLGTAIIAITLPVLLMLADAITKIVVSDKNATSRKVFDLLGNPTVALLIAVLFCYFFLGLGSGHEP